VRQGILRSVGGTLALPEGGEDQDYADDPESGAENRSDAHVSRPNRGYALGIEIGFIVLALASGLAFLAYAILLLWRGQRDAVPLYLYASSVGIGTALMVGLDLLSGFDL
jgi:hypothetical protein